METPKKPASGGRGLKIALALSLSLNLLVLGIIVGAFMRHGGPGGRVEQRIRSYATPYIKALPREQQRALHDRLRAAGNLPDRAARRGLYQQVLAQLRAEPFDADAIKSVLEQQSQNVQGMMSRAQGAWVDVVADMTPAERLAYADTLEERLKRGPRRRWRKRERE